MRKRLFVSRFFFLTVGCLVQRGYAKAWAQVQVTQRSWQEVRHRRDGDRMCSLTIECVLLRMCKRLAGGETQKGHVYCSGIVSYSVIDLVYYYVYCDIYCSTMRGRR